MKVWKRRGKKKGVEERRDESRMRLKPSLSEYHAHVKGYEHGQEWRAGA